MIEDSDGLTTAYYEEIATRYGCAMRTVYRDVDWVTSQLKQGWLPPPPRERLQRSISGAEVDHSEQHFPDHRLAIEDSLVEGRWCNREAQKISDEYDAGGVRHVIRDAEGVKERIIGDMDADGVRLSVSIQMKRLHRTVSRHTSLQNDDLALKAEAELAKLHRGVIPLIGKVSTSEDMSPEEAAFYRQLLGGGGDS